MPTMLVFNQLDRDKCLAGSESERFLTFNSDLNFHSLREFEVRAAAMLSVVPVTSISLL